MNAVQRFVQDYARYVESNRFGTYYINGIPGAGKSTLVEQIKRALPRLVKHTVLLGIYSLDDFSSYAELLTRDLIQQGLIDSKDMVNGACDPIDTFWNRLAEAQVFSERHRVIVMIDLLSPTFLSPEQIAQVFSRLRGLAAANMSKDHRFSLHHIVIGRWNHPALMRHYERVTTLSFPYTTGLNYQHWRGIDAQDVIDLLADQPYRELRGSLLHEITGGHPGAINAILSESADQASMAWQFARVQTVVQQSALTEQLIAYWKHLTKQDFQSLCHLLNARRLALNAHPLGWQPLVDAGLVAVDDASSLPNVRIASWFVESALRIHWRAMTDLEPPLLDIADVLPEVKTFNLAAYRLINEIETQLRSAASVMIRRCNPERERVALEGYVVKETPDGRVTDLGGRAQKYRSNATQGDATQLEQPLMAYTELLDLKELFATEMTDEPLFRGYTDALSEIARLIDRLSRLRNRVMHNQLIGDETLDELTRFQSLLIDKVGAVLM